MALAFRACDFDQRPLVDHGRPTKQRPCDHDLVLARKLPDQGGWCIGEDGQSFSQIVTRGEFGVRNKIDQDAVKQVDVIRPEIFAPCRNSSAIRRVASARRWGSPCLTNSSSPGISDAANVIKRTQTHANSKPSASFRAI